MAPLNIRGCGFTEIVSTKAQFLKFVIGEAQNVSKRTPKCNSKQTSSVVSRELPTVSTKAASDFEP